MALRDSTTGPSSRYTVALLLFLPPLLIWNFRSIVFIEKERDFVGCQWRNSHRTLFIGVAYSPGRVHVPEVSWVISLYLFAFSPYSLFYFFCEDVDSGAR